MKKPMFSKGLAVALTAGMALVLVVALFAIFAYNNHIAAWGWSPDNATGAGGQAIAAQYATEPAAQAFAQSSVISSILNKVEPLPIDEPRISTPRITIEPDPIENPKFPIRTPEPSMQPIQTPQPTDPSPVEPQPTEPSPTAPQPPAPQLPAPTTEDGATQPETGGAGAPGDGEQSPGPEGGDGSAGGAPNGGDAGAGAGGSAGAGMEVKPKGISVSPRNISMNIGASRGIAAIISPDDAWDQTVAWRSGDTSVATVSDAGVVRAVGVGTASISARTSNGIAAYCAVTVYAPIDPFSVNGAGAGGPFGEDAWVYKYANFSGWAFAELSQAHTLMLAPDILLGSDLTMPITRLEFAAVSVKAYEALSGAALAPPDDASPFADTDDPEALKAYGAGIAVGTSPGMFDPDSLLSREEAATMLTRVYKKASMGGWSLEEDSKFVIPYTMPEPFADDDRISSWARDSVYFMASSGIILGTGGNMFSPRAEAAAATAAAAAVAAAAGDGGTATREQALLIAARLIENYG